MTGDWKDALGSLLNSGDLPEGDESVDSSISEEVRENTAPKKGLETLHIVMERKGRAGKTATIVEGFTCTDERLKEVAAMLKKSLGVGGSARGGEILIQGDHRERVKKELLGMGYRVKA